MQLRRTLIVVLALLGVLVQPGHADAEPGITPVGTLERFPQEAIDAFGPSMTGDDVPTRNTGGTLLPVPGAGQLWQVYRHTFMPRTGVLVRDARNGHVLGTFVLEKRLRRATFSPTEGGEWLHATDGGTRVYVVTEPNELLEIDTATFAVRSLGRLTVLPSELVSAVSGGLEPLRVAGLTYDAVTGDLLVLYGGPPMSSVANRLTILQRIDLDTGERTSRRVRSCTGPLPSTDLGGDTYAAELLLANDSVYVTCQTRLAWFFLQPVVPDDTRAVVVRLPRATLWGDGEESSVDAGRWSNANLVDPDGGRIAVFDLAGRVTVVDVATMAVVGTFETTTGGSGRIGAGLDRSSGRFFFRGNAGFGYVDIRSTPLPAPTVDASAAAAGQERIVPDGNKVYVLPGHGSTFSKADHYTIYNVAP